MMDSNWDKTMVRKEFENNQCYHHWCLIKRPGTFESIPYLKFGYISKRMREDTHFSDLHPLISKPPPAPCSWYYQKLSEKNAHILTMLMSQIKMQNNKIFRIYDNKITVTLQYSSAFSFQKFCCRNMQRDKDEMLVI